MIQLKSEELTRGKSKALYKIAKKASQLALDGNTSMIKDFLSCRCNWSEKSQITIEIEKIEDKGPSKTEEALDKMSNEELGEFKILHGKMHEIIDRTIQREHRPDHGWIDTLGK